MDGGNGNGLGGSRAPNHSQQQLDYREEAALASMLCFSMMMTRRVMQYDTLDILNRGAAAGTYQAYLSGHRYRLAVAYHPVTSSDRNAACPVAESVVGEGNIGHVAAEAETKAVVDTAAAAGFEWAAVGTLLAVIEMS